MCIACDYPELRGMPRQQAITCSACGQPWTAQHRCNVPPAIDTSCYSDAALAQLADHLALVLDGRRKARASAADGSAGA